MKIRCAHVDDLFPPHTEEELLILEKALFSSARHHAQECRYAADIEIMVMIDMEKSPESYGLTQDLARRLIPNLMIRIED